MSKSIKIWSGAIIGAIIAGAAIYVLMRMLPEITAQDLTTAIHQITWPRLIFAGLAIIACYGALTAYDSIALSTIGKPLHWRTTAAGAISAYALSHNLGVAPITASGARWRIYAPHGINLPDIARIVIITGMSFWLGIILLVGIGLIVVPDVISQSIPMVGNAGGPQIVGIAIIAFNLGYLIAIGRGMRNIGWRHISIPLPIMRHAVGQNLLGAVEIALASAALALLIPSATWADYPAIFLAYLIAFLSVLITHAPGGIGVLELVIVAMLPEMNKADLIAGLLLFRVGFHLVPLAIAAIILIFAGPAKTAVSERIKASELATEQ